MSDSYIEICDLALMCRLGACEKERTFPQKVFVSLCIFADYSKSEGSDVLADTIDYKDVVVALQEMTASSEFCLIESLARAIKEKVLVMSQASSVAVKVRKPNVLMEAGAVSYNLIN
jgi:7,8-dihydroneopterin aldolase/epimerase/oxygenase